MDGNGSKKLSSPTELDSKSIAKRYSKTFEH